MPDRLSPSASNGNGKPLACVIFSQERMFRELLASQLSIRSGLSVVGQAGKPPEFRRVCEERAPNLFLLHVPAEPEVCPLLIEDFLEAEPDGRLIAITRKGRSFTAPECLNGRTMITVDHDDSLRSLCTALDTLRGPVRTVQRPGLRGRLGGRSLSQRESEVFALIGEGLTNRQIAERLGLSDHTVRTHRKRIAAKLGTEGGELTRWAIVSRQTDLVTTDAQ